MRAEIIAIGDELTSGQRLNTNSQWLSQQLGDLGVETICHTTIGDSLADNVEAFRLATERADIVISSGGLGPTLDDLTRDALAAAFDCPLVLHEESLAIIQAMFASRNRDMPPNNRVQALFPTGSQVIPNPHGSAPGIDMLVTSRTRVSRIFALPGVPAEMKQMWSETVAGRIENQLGAGAGTWRFHSLKVFGIGESDVEVKLPTLIDRQRIPKVGITVSRATITLRIAARAVTEDEFASLIAPTVNEIRHALGDLVFGERDDELEHVVLRQLSQNKLSLASLEIGAASWIGDWMLKAGHLGVESYVGSLAFPDLQAALRWLDRDSKERLSMSSSDAKNSSLSDAVWCKLAEETRTRFQSDIALVVGIYPTIEQMEIGKSSFEFTFAIATAENVTLVHRTLGGHPDVLGPRVAKTGLDLLRLQLCTILQPLPSEVRSTAGTWESHGDSPG